MATSIRSEDAGQWQIVPPRKTRQSRQPSGMIWLRPCGCMEMEVQRRVISRHVQVETLTQSRE